MSSQEPEGRRVLCSFLHLGKVHLTSGRKGPQCGKGWLHSHALPLGKEAPTVQRRPTRTHARCVPGLHGGATGNWDPSRASLLKELALQGGPQRTPTTLKGKSTTDCGSRPTLRQQMTLMLRGLVGAVALGSSPSAGLSVSRKRRNLEPAWNESLAEVNQHTEKGKTGSDGLSPSLSPRQQVSLARPTGAGHAGLAFPQGQRGPLGAPDHSVVPKTNQMQGFWPKRAALPPVQSGMQLDLPRPALSETFWGTRDTAAALGRPMGVTPSPVWITPSQEHHSLE